MNKNYNKTASIFILPLFYFSSVICNNQILKKLSQNTFNPIKRSFLSITTPEIAQYSEYKKIEAIIKNNDNVTTKEFLLQLAQAGDALLKKIEKDEFFLFYNSTYQKPKLIDSLSFPINPKINVSHLQQLHTLQIMKKDYDTRVVLKNFEPLDNKNQNRIKINSQDLFRWHASRTQKDICGIIKGHELIKNASKEFV